MCHGLFRENIFLHTHVGEDFFHLQRLWEITFEAFDWLFICDDPRDVRDLRVKAVVEIDTQ